MNIESKKTKIYINRMVTIDNRTVFDDFDKCSLTSPGAEVLTTSQFISLHTHTNNGSLTTTSKSWANLSAPFRSETYYSDWGSAPIKS
jgi:hypothetical protein